MKNRRSRPAAAERGSTSTAAAASPPTASRLGSLPGWAQYVAAWLLLSLLLGAVLPEIAFEGQVFYSADSEAPIHFTVAGERALHDHQYPTWNPYLYLGMPSFGSMMFMPYVYPVTVVLQTFGKLPLVPPLGWMLFYFVLAGFGVFVLLRSLQVGFWPSLLAGAAFMLTPHVMSMGVFGHGGKLGAVAFLPYMFWAALSLSRPRWRPVWVAVLALFIGLQMLRGHPQIAYYGLLLVGLLAIVEIVGLWRASGPRVVLPYAAGVTAAVVLGLALGAVLLMPVRDYAPESIRGSETGGGATYEYATKWSLSPSEVPTFLLPSASGFGEATYTGNMPWTNFPNYLGQAVGLFGLLAFVLLRGRLLVLLGLVLVLSLGISFGKEMPLLYNLLYDHLPHFSKFRVPAMILVLFQLAAAIAAGLGLSAAFGVVPRGLQWRFPMSERLGKRTFVGTLIAAAALLLVAWPWAGALAARVLASPRIPPDLAPGFAAIARSLLTGDSMRVAVILVGCAAAVWLAWRRRLPVDAAGVVLVLLLLIDLAVVDRRMVRPDETWPNLDSRITAPSFLEVGDSPMADFLEQQHPDQVEPIRVLPVGKGFNSNHWMSYGISSVGGYHPAKLSRIHSLLLDESLLYTVACARVLGVQYIVAREPINTAARVVWEGAEGVVYEFPDATSRAWVTGRWVPSPGRSECLGVLFGGGIDPDSQVVLEGTPPAALDSTAVGTARITRYTDNRVEIEANSSGPALLVLRDAYHSGWKASVDGRDTPVLPADCLLRAVAVPAGTSQVVFHFEHPGFATGLRLTLAALGVVLVLLGWGVWRGRRSSPVPQLSPAGGGA